MAKRELSEFEKAFAAARREKGPNATFEFKGKKYTTARADDKKDDTSRPKQASFDPELEGMGGANKPPRMGMSAPRVEPSRGPVEKRESVKPSFKSDVRSDKLNYYRYNIEDAVKAAERNGGRSDIKQSMVPAGKFGGYKKGGSVKKYSGGGSASKRADGCAVKGKTRGKFV